MKYLNTDIVLPFLKGVYFPKEAKRGEGKFPSPFIFNSLFEDEDVFDVFLF
jgi:hypothetical protein